MPEEWSNVEGAKQQKGKTAGTSSTQLQAQAARPSGEPSPEGAAAEYAQILTLLNIPLVQPAFQAASDFCDKPPQWCLPDVSCTARLTLSKQVSDHLDEHLKTCEGRYPTSN